MRLGQPRLYKPWFVQPWFVWKKYDWTQRCHSPSPQIPTLKNLVAKKTSLWCRVRTWAVACISRTRATGLRGQLGAIVMQPSGFHKVCLGQDAWGISSTPDIGSGCQELGESESNRICAEPRPPAKNAGGSSASHPRGQWHIYHLSTKHGAQHCQGCLPALDVPLWASHYKEIDIQINPA